MYLGGSCFYRTLIFLILSLSLSLVLFSRNNKSPTKTRKVFERIILHLNQKMGLAVQSQFHVLAVDDNIIDRKLIERLLKTSSYQVTTVDSGSKALEFLGWNEDNNNLNHPSVSPSHQEVEVNLIITDYCMPGMTGYDLLKKIKESSSLRNIPVVIMSSENVPSRINRCLEEGAEEFFLKPVSKSDVNKLKSHMMKYKHSNHGEKTEQDEKIEEDDEILEMQSQCTNKRKSMEEGLSTDRTRPRFSSLAVV